MPTIIHMTVEVSVPVPDKDAIRQAVTTQALQSAAQHLIEAAEDREGNATLSASIKRVKAPEPPVGDTPETMPMSLP